jgi:hypothetical protein
VTLMSLDSLLVFRICCPLVPLRINKLHIKLIRHLQIVMGPSVAIEG